MKNVYTIAPNLYAMKMGAIDVPISAEKSTNHPVIAPVDILSMREGMIHAIASIAIHMPKYMTRLAKKKLNRAGLEATPRAQNADTRRPIDMRRYTRFITELVCRSPRFRYRKGAASHCFCIPLFLYLESHGFAVRHSWDIEISNCDIGI